LLKILYYANALGGQWETYISGFDASNAETDAADALSLEDSDDLRDIDGPDALVSLAHLLEGGRRRRQTWDDPLRRILDIHLADCRKPLIPPEEFINEPLSEIVEMDKDFIHYTATLEGDFHFTFMLHPFVLTPVVKHVAMYFDSRIRMMNERRAAMLQGLWGDVSTPHLRLRVRRDHLVDDALVNVSIGIS
jgi:ubiquitin-protein ligase E3 A